METKDPEEEENPEVTRAKEFITRLKRSNHKVAVRDLHIASCAGISLQHFCALIGASNFVYLTDGYL